MQDTTRLWINQFRDLEIFANVGRKIPDDIRSVSNWSQAIRRMDTSKWRNIKLRNLGSFSNSYDKEFGNINNGWNELVNELRAEIWAIVDGKVQPLMAIHSWPKIMLKTVRLDFLDMGICHELSRFGHSELVENLEYWYFKGHFPCGWDGKYPEGRLVVF